MSRNIAVSDALYDGLAAEARRRGVTIEQLLADWRTDQESDRRRAAVEHVEAIERRLRAKYGRMPDSAELVREDRARQDVESLVVDSSVVIKWFVEETDSDRARVVRRR